MTEPARRRCKSRGAGTRREIWELRLYVIGRSPKCVRAIENLQVACEQHLAGRYRIEVVDLLENPRLAVDDQILAVPTLVRKLPPPIRKIVGDLSDTDRLLDRAAASTAKGRGNMTGIAADPFSVWSRTMNHEPEGRHPATGLGRARPDGCGQRAAEPAARPAGRRRFSATARRAVRSAGAADLVRGDDAPRRSGRHRGQQR